MTKLVRLLAGISAVLTSTWLVGCSSHIVVEEVPYKQIDHLDGVPVQLASQQQITVNQLQSDGTYVQVESTLYPIADHSRLFVVGIKADTFSNASLTLGLNSDGTLGNVGITSTPSGQQALTQLGTSVSNITTQASTYDAQREKAEQTALQQAAAATQAQQAIPATQSAAVLAYHQAVLAVMQQQVSIQSLIANPSTATSPTQLQDAQLQLGVMEYQANVAARAIGLPAPYPSINFSGQ